MRPCRAAAAFYPDLLLVLRLNEPDKSKSTWLGQNSYHHSTGLLCTRSQTNANLKELCISSLSPGDTMPIKKASARSLPTCSCKAPLEQDEF